ncbi:ABC transporter substrate-binding protein [Prosthecomicrobium sp. N25]|uniref:ABC transporter substrate-binding protein n=1 Tax=Prosthecomicrobium sp. N25 TaxID=3129254 RepID=UPI003077B9C5
MQLSRRTFNGMLGSSLAGSLLGPFGAGFARAQTKPLTVALEEIPKQLDPLRYLTNPGYRVMYNIYDTLLDVDFKKDGALKPALASSWKRVDEKTIDVTLRDGVLFHDGSPLTVDDVLFTFSTERMFDKASPGFAVAQQLLSTIAKVEAVDGKTVRVVSKIADPALELRLTAWGSQIISKSAFQKAGGWDGFARKPVGTGPFSVVNLSPEEVRLAAFPQYWGGAPSIPTLVYRSSPELSSRIAGLAAGDFDLIADVPPDQFPAVTRSPNLVIAGGPIASIRVVKFDTRNAALKDPRVRQALGFAIDRAAIVKALWQDLVEIPRGHQLASYGELYDKNRPALVYDPDKAKKLLAAGGYKGEVIPYRIRTNAYGPELATAQILVSMWNAVGVNIDLQIKENFGQMLAYPGTGMRNGVDPVLINDPLFSLWRSYNEAEKDVWSNEDFYKAGHVLESSMDPAERKKAMGQMLDIFDADPPSIILHTMGLFYGMNKKVKWTPYKHVYMDFRKENASIAT